MFRALQPFDLPRWLLMGRAGRRNRVHTRASLSHALPTVVGLTDDSIRALSKSGRVLAMAQTDGLRIASLAVATQKSGPASWELSRLQVRDGYHETVSDLVNAVTGAAFLRGAQQVSARILAQDPLGEELRRAGLFPSRSETLYRALGTGRPKRRPPGVRPKTAADEHGLFRLYSAATPSEVRALEGMTLDQWAASKWACSGRFISASEYVLETGSVVAGWLRVVNRRLGTADLTVMLSPERSYAEAAALLKFGLSRVPEGRPVNLLVPEYEIATQRAAQDEGMQIEANLQVQVRAARATEKILKEVGAYNVVSP
jgi:hypothetical protein